MSFMVWKFPLENGYHNQWKLEMPKNAKIISMQYQDGVPTIWAMVDPYAPKERRYIKLFGTGNTISNPDFGYVFIATLQDGPYVWHFFEEILND